MLNRQNQKKRVKKKLKKKKNKEIKGRYCQFGKNVWVFYYEKENKKEKK
jgi:hypothetical protein